MVAWILLIMNSELLSGRLNTDVGTLKSCSMFSLRYRLVNLLLTMPFFFIACNHESLVEMDEEDDGALVYISSPDQNYMFERVDWKSDLDTVSSTIINIDTSRTYQTIDGFGFALTGGSAQHLLQLSSRKRSDLLDELFGTENDGIGVSYLRISIGSSDLDEKVFSYDDVPPGMFDEDLSEFSLVEDKDDLIPILKEILTINPNIKIMASPWSAPAWMKSNQSSVGGTLLPKFYSVYANYLLLYVQKMADHGIYIDAMTVQNEPLHPGNNPSMYMTPEDQAVFVGQYLGPVFENSSTTIKLVIYDHNADRIDYPLTVLNDVEASKYVDGSAFHLYGGEIDNLSQLHSAFPDKNIYFTEQWIGAPGNFQEDIRWHMKNIIIGATKNWARTVLEWNLASNLALEPHTEGGCTRCLGAITIDNNTIIKNSAYYIIAHASKFVRPGSKRVFSSENITLPNVSFLTKDKRVVTILMNDADTEKAFTLKLGQRKYNYKLQPGAVITSVIDL